MSYDPEERRETALLAKLVSEIEKHGPMSVEHYMARCQYDANGYLAVDAPIGAKGDFTTAPEISQVFGEMIGLWMAVVWDRMGRPAPVSVVEYGPGRGTMMRDALRAARVVPDFLASIRLFLVEARRGFEAVQRQTLANVPCPVAWVKTDLSAFPGPAIVVANEFLDVWTIHQWVKSETGWRQRGVGLDASGKLAFTLLDASGEPAFTLITKDSVVAPGSDLAWRLANESVAPPDLDAAWPEAVDGDIFESPDLSHIAEELSEAAKQGPVAALFIDYGHAKPALGDTLQAVRRHAHEHPLCSPGEADLSAQVNFADFANEARYREFAVDGPVTQAEFLGSLGIIERASRLMSANPTKAAEIEAGVARLMASTGMGTRFKAIGARSPDLQVLPGFPA